MDVKVIPYGQELGRVVYRLNTFNKGLEQSQLSCGGYGDIGSISATVNSKAVMIRGGFDRGCEDGSFNRGDGRSSASISLRRSEMVASECSTVMIDGAEELVVVDLGEDGAVTGEEEVSLDSGDIS